MTILQRLPALTLIVLLLGFDANADADLDEYRSQYGDQGLTAEDRDNLRALRSQSRATGASSLPGQTVFTYGGADMPTVVCAVLRLTDLWLEAGEKLISVNIGDTANWHIDTTKSGSSDGVVSHLILKPLQAGLETSLLISTNRRIYNLGLRSTAESYMPSVKFVYADGGITRVKLKDGKGNALSASASAFSDEENGDAFEEGGTFGQGSRDPYASAADRLDFNYEFSGDSEVMPVRVFNDGTRTVVEFAQAIGSESTPAVYLMQENSSWLGTESSKAEFANFRINGKKMVIDGIVKHARLQFGSGQSGKTAEFHYMG